MSLFTICILISIFFWGKEFFIIIKIFLFHVETPALMETLPVQSVLNLWERAQIPNGRSMLLALGFDDNEINLAQLGKVMEDEMRILDEEPQITLMKASLVLQTVELSSLRQTARQLYDENTKLRTDNKDANKRIAIFTAEIDERHASLEEATKKEVTKLYGTPFKKHVILHTFTPDWNLSIGI